MNMGLNEDILTAVREVLKGDHNVTGEKIFWSRAKGNYNTVSDIDIAIFGKVGMLPTEKI